MTSLELLKKQAKQLVRGHRDGDYSTAALIRHNLAKYDSLSDREVLDAKFQLSDAQAVVARIEGFARWEDLAAGIKQVTLPESGAGHRPTLLNAYPQLFVTDMAATCAYYGRVFGFRTVFLHGSPPFYGQVMRDGARLNLRLVDVGVLDPAIREREQLLAAWIPTENVKGLYAEFKEAGADFHTTYQRVSGPSEHFIVRDPDGNLLCFGMVAPSRSD
jgi:catechol 2,3-dioxygenase-like lactoylglutathione lyase family enzyme